MTVTASHVSSSSFLLVSASARRAGASRQRRRRPQTGPGFQDLRRLPRAAGRAAKRCEARGGALGRKAAARRCARARTAAGALGIADDVGHASLEAHERRQVRRLARVILREAVSCGGAARQRPAACAQRPGCQRSASRRPNPSNGSNCGWLGHAGAAPRCRGSAAPAAAPRRTPRQHWAVTHPCPGGAASAFSEGNRGSRSAGARTGRRGRPARQTRAGQRCAQLAPSCATWLRSAA